MDNSAVPLYLRPINRDTAYYVGRHNSDQTVFAYERISKSDLQDISISLRFSAISKLQDNILQRDRAPENDPHQPVNENAFTDEIRLMLMISQSIRHSDAYLEFIDACTKHLFARLLEAQKFRKLIKTWNQIAPSDKKHAIRLREKYHSVAAKKTSKSTIVNTNITFIDDPSTNPSVISRPCRVYGFSHGTIDRCNSKRKIEISAHPLGPFNRAEMAMKTGHHEKTHDIGLQQAILFARGDYYALGDLIDDAELWLHLKQQRAIISNRIRTPYRQQFHEVIAFDQGDQMEQFVREDLLNLPPKTTPPVPL